MAKWKLFLLRSIGLETADLDERSTNALLLRMVPFVERNYNMVELGPRGGDLPVQQGVAVLRRPDNVVFNLELGVAPNW
jgi:predicted ATP-dependent Lon-type protease